MPLVPTGHILNAPPTHSFSYSLFPLSLPTYLTFLSSPACHPSLLQSPPPYRFSLPLLATPPSPQSSHVSNSSQNSMGVNLLPLHSSPHPTLPVLSQFIWKILTPLYIHVLASAVCCTSWSKIQVILHHRPSFHGGEFRGTFVFENLDRLYRTRMNFIMGLWLWPYSTIPLSPSCFHCFNHA